MSVPLAERVSSHASWDILAHDWPRKSWEYPWPWLAKNIVVHAYLRISMPIPSWRQSSWEPIIWTLCWAEDNNWVPDSIFLYSICTYTAFFSTLAYTYKLKYIKASHRLHLEEKAAWSSLCSTVSMFIVLDLKIFCLMITVCSTVSHSHRPRLEKNLPDDHCGRLSVIVMVLVIRIKLPYDHCHQKYFWWSPWSNAIPFLGPCH
jgi:hypothetical protein